MAKTRVAPFDYALDFKQLNFRAHPELYRVGKGEQGVLMVEPYKSEILPVWRFKTPADARASSEKIYEMFLAYKRQADFVGADMARKFLQMGYTRARRYANHKGGKKYDEQGKELPRLKRQEQDAEKAESARIFYAKWKQAREDADYLRMKQEHRERYERVN